MDASRSNCSSAPTATPHSNASLVDSTASFTIIYSRGYDNREQNLQTYRGPWANDRYLIT